MRKNVYRIIAAVSALVLAGGGWVLATGQRAGANQDFTVTQRFTNYEFVGADGTTSISTLPAHPVPGDRIFTRFTLTQGSTVVGFVSFLNTATFNDDDIATGIYAFTGRGDIHATSYVRGGFDFAHFPTVYDGTIDGGTFAYAHASGSVHVVAQGGVYTASFSF
jgi:hypothetical protein